VGEVFILFLNWVYTSGIIPTIHALSWYISPTAYHRYSLFSTQNGGGLCVSSLGQSATALCLSCLSGDVYISWAVTTHLSPAWQQQTVAAATQRVAHRGDKLLIVWVPFPVATSLISRQEEGPTCPFNLFLTTDCHTHRDHAVLDVYCACCYLLSLNLFSQPHHLCTSRCLYRLFTLTHLSRFFSPDINECLSARACQFNERCMNTEGSYVCQRLITCPPGYQINNDICEGTLHLINCQQHQSFFYFQCRTETSISYWRMF